MTHVPWCMPGFLTSGFCRSWWLRKRFRHSWRMRKPRFYVSGKRPMPPVIMEHDHICNMVVLPLSNTAGKRVMKTLQWRHNERDGVSNYQHHDCLLNGLFRRKWQKTLNFRVTGPCAGNSHLTGEFPTQRASNAENVFRSMTSSWISA